MYLGEGAGVIEGDRTAQIFCRVVGNPPSECFLPDLAFRSPSRGKAPLGVVRIPIPLFRRLGCHFASTIPLQVDHEPIAQGILYSEQDPRGHCRIGGASPNR